MAASLFLIIDLENYEEWKQLFDSDPIGRKEVADSTRSTAPWTTPARSSWGSNTRRWTTHRPFGRNCLIRGSSIASRPSWARQSSSSLRRSATERSPC